MTISSDAIRKAGPYVGNSIVTVFAFAFKTFSASDLSVTLLTTATGVQQLLVLNTDYTVQLNGNQDTNPGGTITTIGAISPIANTKTLTISGNVMADTQGTDLVTPGPWVPDDVEKMVDRAMIGIQQLRDRAIKFPAIDSIAPVDLPQAEVRASKFLAFDAAGNVIASTGTGADAGLRTDLASSAVGLGAALVKWIQNGVGAIARTVLDFLLDRICVFDFMTTAQIADVRAKTYTLDVSAAIMAAALASSTAGGKQIHCPAGGYLIAAQLAFIVGTHNLAKFIGHGFEATVFKKGFNGLLIAQNGRGVEFENIHFHGNNALFTGKGIQFQANSAYSALPRCTFDSFQDIHVEFLADSGYDFRAPDLRCVLAGGQINPFTVVKTGVDTQAMHRSFSGGGFDGVLDFSGAQATKITTSRFFDIITTNATSVFSVVNCSWALGGANTTISAVNCDIGETRFAGGVTLLAGCSGSFIGNWQTAGIFTDQSSGAMYVFHRNGADSFVHIGVHVLDNTNNPLNVSSVQTSRITFSGDANINFGPGDARTFFFFTPLTADRTATWVPGTAQQGARFRFVRLAAATGNFKFTIAGATACVLGPSMWAEYEYDGAALQFVEQGFIGPNLPVTVTIAVGAAVVLATGVAATVTSLTLPAGEWEVSGVVDYNFAATTNYTALQQGVSNVAATLGGQDTFTALVSAGNVPTGAVDMALTTPRVRFSLAANTLIYLVAKAAFTVAALKAYGTIKAERVG